MKKSRTRDASSAPSLARRSLIGAGALAAVTAVVADAAPAEAAVSISQGELDRIAVVASKARFSAIDASGVTDSSAGLQQAINATPSGGLLIIPTGTYLVGTALYPKLQKSMRISAHGATLIATAASSIFSVSGTYGTVFNVSSVTSVTPSGLSPTTQLVLSATPPWTTGTVIKIVADDPIPERRPGSDGLESRVGEFATVRSVSGTTVLLGGLLRDTYTTNVRAAAISEQTFSLEGGTLMTAKARMGVANNPLVFLSRLRAPQIIDVNVPRAGGTVFRFGSCYGYLVQNASIGYAVDNPATNQFGYGVADVSSSFGRVEGGTYSHVRHAYSDDTNRVAANGEISEHGRTYGTVVSSVSAMMTTSTSFDTHHNSQNVTFIGCTATGGVNQGGQGQSGFQLRGINHQVIGCSAMGVDNGVLVNDEGKGGDSRLHRISDLRVSDARGAAVRVARRPPGHPQQLTLDPQPSVTIDGVQAERSGSLLRSYNATVLMSDAVFRAAAVPPVPGEYHGVYAENSEVRLRDVIIDFEANIEGTPRPITSGAPVGSTPGWQVTELHNVEIRATAGVVARTWGALSGPNHIVRAWNLRITYPFKFLPGENLAPESSIEWRCDRPADGQSEIPDSSRFIFGNAEVTAIPERIVQSPDPTLFIRLTATNTLTMSALPAGRRMGQRIHIHNAGARPITIQHGAAGRTELAGGANKVLAVNDQAQLLWDGGSWRETT